MQSLHTGLRIFIALIFIQYAATAQVIKIKVSNPAPRVGDELSISYNIENNAGQDLQRGLLGLGAISFTSVFLADTGVVKIGPMSIALNDEIFKTDSVSLHVSPALPPAIKEALWVRKVKSNATTFIIVEQRLSAESNKKFAELSIDKIKKLGFNIEVEGSQQSMQSTLLGMIQYRISIYRVLMEDKLMKLDKSYFTNLPEHSFFE
jgi:hypothetical protein